MGNQNCSGDSPCQEEDPDETDSQHFLNELTYIQKEDLGAPQPPTIYSFREMFIQRREKFFESK